MAIFNTTPLADSVSPIATIFLELQKSVKSFRGDKTIDDLAKQMAHWVDLAKRLHATVAADHDRLLANARTEAARMNRQLVQYELDMALEQQAMTIALAVAYDVFKHSAAAANARQAKAMAELDYLQSEAMTKRRKALAAAEDAMGQAEHWGNVARDLQREVAELKRELVALQAELNFEHKQPQQVKRKKPHGGRRDYEGE